MEDKSTNDGAMVISYLALRKAIGILGLAFPLVLALGAWLIFKTGIQGSISDYYYTGMRDVFVGTLWAIGFFLFSYKGPERVDAIAGNLGCIFAVAVTLFPTTPDSVDHATFIGGLHLTFAALLFLTLTFFSLFLFTKTDPSKRPSPEKLKRNRVYKIAGYTMAASILLILVYYRVSIVTASLKPYHPVFWLETITVVAFGISWLTKGEAILQDREV